MDGWFWLITLLGGLSILAWVCALKYCSALDRLEHEANAAAREERRFQSHMRRREVEHLVQLYDKPELLR